MLHLRPTDHSLFSLSPLLGRRPTPLLRPGPPGSADQGRTVDRRAQGRRTRRTAQRDRDRRPLPGRGWWVKKMRQNLNFWDDFWWNRKNPEVFTTCWWSLWRPQVCAQIVRNQTNTTLPFPQAGTAQKAFCGDQGCSAFPFSVKIWRFFPFSVNKILKIFPFWFFFKFSVRDPIPCTARWWGL